MVFESLVSDLLNRFIGDYVENLDKSQLKIGIWGGKRLFVKTVRLHQCKETLVSIQFWFVVLHNVLYRYTVRASCKLNAVSIKVSRAGLVSVL